MNTDAILSNKTVQKLAFIFMDAGEDLYLVGGSVRDALLGSYDDLDFTTPARPDRIVELVQHLGTIWDAGKNYGTIGVQVNGEKVEITTFRADTYQPESRNPEVVFGDNIKDDLKRRDFTMNAMAIKLTGFDARSLVDPFKGNADLQRKVLVTPLDPVVTIQDDPLRSLRAIRFAATRDMRIDFELADAIRENASRLSMISQERKTAELMKIADKGIEALIKAADWASSLHVTKHLFGNLVLNRNLLNKVSAQGVDALAAISCDTPDSYGALEEMRFSTDDCRRVTAIHSVVSRIRHGGDEGWERKVTRYMPEDLLIVAGNIALHLYQSFNNELSIAWAMRDELTKPLPVNGNHFVVQGYHGPPVGAAMNAVEKAFLGNPALSYDEALSVGVAAAKAAQ